MAKAGSGSERLLRYSSERMLPPPGDAAELGVLRLHSSLVVGPQCLKVPTVEGEAVYRVS